MVKFDEVRDQILEKLNSDELNIRQEIQEELSLIDGFVNQPLAEVVGEIVIGASVVPMIMAVGNDYSQSQETLPTAWPISR